MGTATDEQDLVNFRASLMREYHEVADFVAFLERELPQIAGFDADRLVQNSQEKERRVNLLAALGERRDNFLKLRGYAPTGVGMEAFLLDHPEFNATMGAVWRTIVANAANARKQNLTNGRLIACQLQHYAEQLTSLTRLARPAQTYGADGLPRYA